GDQAPAEHGELPPASLDRAHGKDWLRGRNVVPRRHGRELGDLKQVGQLLGRCSESKSSTHTPILTERGPRAPRQQVDQRGGASGNGVNRQIWWRAGYGSRTRLTALGRLGTAAIPIPQ